MSIHDYLTVLRERWVIVVSAALIILVAASTAWFVRPPEYTANLTMYVSAQNVDTNAFQGAQLSQERVTSYVELVSSTRVSREVIEELGLVGTPEEVAERIAATSAPDSVLIAVAVTGTDPVRAAEVANVVGTVFTSLVTELERPTGPDGVPPVAVRVVEPAAVPAEPSSPGLAVALALGLLAGVAVGAAAAIARNALDRSVRSPDHLTEAAAAPNLGTIAFDSAVPKRPLAVQEDAQSPRSEAFRQLRTNLQFIDVDNPRKVILVTSALPGEGKSTTLVNLAIALASAEHRVLVIEADLRRPRVADLLGLERAIGLTSVLSGRVRIGQAIQPWTFGGFDVLASGQLPPNPAELLASRHMKAVLDELRARYDVVLIDSPPLLPVADAAALAPATDGAILVCRFKRTTRDQVHNAAQALEAVSAELLGTVLNMVPTAGPRAYAQYRSYYRADLALASGAGVESTDRLAVAVPSSRNGRPSPRPRSSTTETT